MASTHRPPAPTSPLHALDRLVVILIGVSQLVAALGLLLFAIMIMGSYILSPFGLVLAGYAGAGAVFAVRLVRRDAARLLSIVWLGAWMAASIAFLVRRLNIPPQPPSPIWPYPSPPPDHTFAQVMVLWATGAFLCLCASTIARHVRSSARAR